MTREVGVGLGGGVVKGVGLAVGVSWMAGGAGTGGWRGGRGGFILTPGLDGGEVLVQRAEAAELAHEHVGSHRGVQAGDAQRCILLRPADSHASPAQFYTL